MDNWNRDQQNKHTEMTAQRRLRRRTGEAAEPSAEAEKPEVEWPVRPSEAAAPSAGDTAETPAAAEEAVKAPEAPEAEAPAAPERAETKADEAEQPPVRQAADSRVPPEARRMAAAPYGTSRPDAKRPGTRPMTAPNRPPVQAERRPAVRPVRPEGAAQARQPSRPVPEDKRRLGIGYSPGRMAEGMTQQLPVQDESREAYYQRDARAYLDKKKQPFRRDAGRPAPERPGHTGLKIIVALLVVAGIALTILMIMQSRKKAAPAETQNAAVISFDLPDTKDRIAPTDLTFSAVTEAEVEDIRLRADNGAEVNTEASHVDTTVGRIWMMVMHLKDGFSGNVALQIFRNEEEGWIDTSHQIKLEVEGPIATPTPAPGDAEPTVTPTMNGEVIFADDAPEETEAPQEEETDAAQEGEDAGTEENADADGNAGAEADGEGEAWPGDETDGESEATPEENYGEDSVEEVEPLEELPWDGSDGTTPAPEEDIGSDGTLKIPDLTPTPEPEEEPEATVTPPLTAEAVPEANPDIITNITIYTGNKKEKDYVRPAKDLVHMPVADEYTTKKLGVITFRGDNFRRNAAVGTQAAAPEELKILWDVDAGSAKGEKQTYYGYGWTGQAAIARWSTQVRTASNLNDTKLEKSALKEVIIAGLDGNIRFLDLEDGSLTRNSIKVGFPMRGTPSLDTRGAPFISVGQFARKMKGKQGKIGLRLYNLYSQKQMTLIDGLDGKQHRPVNNIGSFETSALIDRTSDTLITAGTNGALYLISLDSNFDYKAGVYQISPTITMMTSKVRNQKNKALAAIESSPAAYDKYVYYADMGGVLRCVDTDTLYPIWAVETGDAVMAAVALDLTADRQLNLYTANMLANRRRGDGQIQIRRYDALSGREAWCTDIGVFKGKKDNDDVGAKASPVIGQNGLNDLVYFTVTGLSEEGRGALGLGEDVAALIALRKEDGSIAWVFGMESRSESSPVAVYDTEGNGWIIQCEQDGTIHLLDGLSGREISSLKLDEGAEIEASPAVYSNVMVIGTTGKDGSKVYGIEIRNALSGNRKETGGDEEDSGGT